MASEQEEFWRGEFGTTYHRRNRGELMIANNMKFWRRVLGDYVNWPNSWRPKVIEFGAGNGLNLVSLSRLGIPVGNMTAIEINASACEELRRIDGLAVQECSVFERRYDDGYGHVYDMVVSSGFLIHVGPEELERAYTELHNACAPGGVIVLIEYFAPTETEVSYRGNSAKLWRRNYGKGMLERFPDLGLFSYDFVADIDPICPRDNVTIWTLSKAKR